MNLMTRRFKVVDILYIVFMIVPVCLGIILKVLTTPVTDGRDTSLVTNMEQKKGSRTSVTLKIRPL